MTNIYFEDEIVSENDLYFVCYMIERVSRRIKQKNKYIVNRVGKEEWLRILSLANVMHCENPLKVEDEWIEEYALQEGGFDIKKVDKELVERIPSEMQIGKVYMRLIMDTLLPQENYADALIRVYNDGICEKLDYYDCGAYCEPSYVIARAYNEGGF